MSYFRHGLVPLSTLFIRQDQSAVVTNLLNMTLCFPNPSEVNYLRVIYQCSVITQRTTFKEPNTCLLVLLQTDSPISWYSSAGSSVADTITHKTPITSRVSEHGKHYHYSSLDRFSCKDWFMSRESTIAKSERHPNRIHFWRVRVQLLESPQSSWMLMNAHHIESFYNYPVRVFPGVHVGLFQSRCAEPSWDMFFHYSFTAGDHFAVTRYDRDKPVLDSSS